MDISRNRRAGAVAIFLLTALSVVSALSAGCSNRLGDVQPENQPPKPRPVATLAVNPADQTLVNTAWENYQKLNAIYIEAAQTGDYNWDKDQTKRPMYQYASGLMLVALERDLDILRENGFVRTGQPQITLRRVISVSPTTLIVESCVDDTGTDTVDKDTKKSVTAPGQNKKYPVTLRAGLYPDGVWRWVESHADRGSSC